MINIVYLYGKSAKWYFYILLIQNYYYIIFANIKVVISLLNVCILLLLKRMISVNICR